MDDSVIICNEIIDSHEEETKINFNEKDLSVYCNCIFINY